jgi:hypothetical protein
VQSCSLREQHGLVTGAVTIAANMTVPDEFRLDGVPLLARRGQTGPQHRVDH